MEGSSVGAAARPAGTVPRAYYSRRRPRRSMYAPAPSALAPAASNGAASSRGMPPALGAVVVVVVVAPVEVVLGTKRNGVGVASGCAWAAGFAWAAGCV